MEYLTKEEINGKFSGLQRSQVRLLVGIMFNTNKFVNSVPLGRDHPHTVSEVDNRYSYQGPNTVSNYSGITVPLKYWRYMLGTLEFNGDTSSSANWETYSMSGTRDDSRSEGTHMKASFLYDADYHGNRVTHQFVVNYRGPKGEFSSYVGNVEDFFNQVAEYYKTVAKYLETLEASEKFGLGVKESPLRIFSKK